MGDYSIQTVRDYLIALRLLHQGPRGDDFRSGAANLAKLASEMIFRAKDHAVTGKSHKEYRIDHEQIIENPEKFLGQNLEYLLKLRYPPDFIGPHYQVPMQDLPVILVNQGDYEHSKVTTSVANHLNDEVAA